MKNEENKWTKFYKRANTLSGGTLGVVGKAINSFNETQALQAAAALAYYALFSLFPLLLLLIVIGSFVLQRDVAQQQVLKAASENLPGSQTLIQQNIQRVLQLRGPVGLIGIVSLLWSASGFFNTLVFNINSAWPKVEVRNFLQQRLVAVAIVVGLIILLIVSVLSTVAFNLLAQLSIPIGGGISLYNSQVWQIWSNLLPILFRLLVFWGLYRWVPTAKVGWWAALWGAIVAAIGWELTTIGFSWYLSSGLASYELVYGSVGTIVVLMLWIYLGSLITLFGAHLSSAVDQR